MSNLPKIVRGFALRRRATLVIVVAALVVAAPLYKMTFLLPRSVPWLELVLVWVSLWFLGSEFWQKLVAQLGRLDP